VQVEKNYEWTFEGLLVVVVVSKIFVVLMLRVRLG
jgi:hypothetical protein